MRCSLIVSGKEPIILKSLESDTIGMFIVSDDGWTGSPAPRESPITRVQTTGDYFPPRLTQGARTVTLEALGVFESELEAREKVNHVLSFIGEKITLRVEDPDAVRSVTGYISDDPRFVFLENGRVIQFSIILTCPDPYKYEDAQAFAAANGVIKALNRGNVPTYPVVKVAGAVTSLTVACGSQQVKWEGNANGLTIDFKAMKPSSGILTLDNAFQLMPGWSTINVSTNTASVLVSSAWR